MLCKSLIVFSICFLLVVEVRAEVAIIVNPNNTANWNDGEIKDYLKDIFLNKKEKFPDGANAKPVDQSEGRPIRNEFYLKLAEKDETDMNVYWSNLIFTGNGRPPKAVGDDTSVKRFVAENINGIGYINTTFIDKTVKVIYTLK